MPTKERARDRGRRLARESYTELASDLRHARLSAGLSQEHVAQVTGLKQSRISRTERAAYPAPRLDEVVIHAATLGLRLSARTFPEGSAVRDAAHLKLLGRLRSLIGTRFTWRSEVPVGGRNDLRAWDAVLTGPATVAIDAETRLHDLQALQRRSELKLRDSGLPCLVLLVSASAHNRAVLREHRAALAATFPLGSRDVLEALRSGQGPAGSGIAIL